MSTGQEDVTPQNPPGGGSVAPSPAALSPVSHTDGPVFLSFFLGFRRPNLITGLSGWRTPN